MSTWWSAVFAEEGSLLVPDRIDSNVELVLQSADAEIEPAEILQVYVGARDECCAGKLPISGRYLLEGRKLMFDPTFDFLEGEHYTVATKDSASSNGNRSEYVLSEFIVGKSGREQAPKVIAIYPGGDDIPENTLRFYIHFSVAMKPHMTSQIIKLVDSEGNSDSEAFMDFKQELWSEDRKRLTLLMDPGRIKRGVAQNNSLGPAFLEGENKSIVIMPGWQSANGEKKMARFEKTFVVSKALRTLPSHDLWTVVPPRVSSHDMLIIKLDRSFDHELLQSGISVLGSDGQAMQGTVTIKSDEKVWQFSPKNAWKQSRIRIAVDTLLEDVAGNNFIELLDRPVETEVHDTNQHVFTVELKPSPL